MAARFPAGVPGVPGGPSGPSGAPPPSALPQQRYAGPAPPQAAPMPPRPYPQPNFVSTVTRSVKTEPVTVNDDKNF